MKFNDYRIYQALGFYEPKSILRRPKNRSILLFVVFSLIFVLSFAFITISSAAERVYYLTNVKGQSMMPTLNSAYAQYNDREKEMDVVYTNSYEKGTRGDIIVDKVDFAQATYVIKRLIALEGDTIRIVVPTDINEPTEVYLNGELLQEDYVKEKHFGGLSYNVLNNSLFNPQSDGTITIPRGYVFYMGDNRNNSSDCRGDGPRIAKNIVGRVDFFVSYPFEDKELMSKSELYWPGFKTIIKYLVDLLF